MPDHVPLASLVHRALRAEPSALDALARRFLRPAYAVALAVVGRPSDAEDVAQDALVSALEKLDQCRDPERFDAWLFTIVRNRARNHLSSRRLRDVPAADEDGGTIPGDHPAPDATAARGALVHALAGLTPTQREVVLLHDLEGWTHAEIAAALGTSEVNARQHLFQARRALRARLDPGPGGAPAA